MYNQVNFFRTNRSGDRCLQKYWIDDFAKEFNVTVNCLIEHNERDIQRLRKNVVS